MTPRRIYAIGPSGAGKDSVLGCLRAQLPAGAPVHFARRTINRPAHAGAESHEALSTSQWQAQCAAQSFAMHWTANGLHYGVRHAELAGPPGTRWVIVNGSRAYLPQALAVCPDTVVLHITASPTVLHQRLLSRGRESPAEISARLARTVQWVPPSGTAPIEIQNNAALQDAVLALVAALQQLPDWPCY